MADNFTRNQVQGIFGEFVAVLDEMIEGGEFSADNVQGIFGEFIPVLDEAAGTPTPPPVAVNLPEYGQVRAAIGDPPVFGATILRS